MKPLRHDGHNDFVVEFMWGLCVSGASLQGPVRALRAFGRRKYNTMKMYRGVL